MSHVTGEYSTQPHGAPAYAQPHHGYQQVAYQEPYAHVPSYQQAPPPLHTHVVSAVACPHCHTVGSIEKEYTVCGIVLAIVFFPIGILCCLAMQEDRCRVCGHRFH